MPWVHALLRGAKVFARANEQGALAVDQGKVEIRYRADDGRAYRARADNVTVADATTILPDATCAPAAPVAPVLKGSAATVAPPAEIVEAGAVPALIAYTDGACTGNPGPAGLGVVLVDQGVTRELSEYLGEGTNNIAELTAILRALELATDRQRSLIIHTDSQYAIGVLAKGWKAKANQVLIAKLRQELARRRPLARFVYVRGHAGIPLNERADELARAAVRDRQR